MREGCLDIRRLEVFCRVVELKSFTRAAEAVRLSQPSVSEHVRALEEGLGEKLLDRLGREVLPTAAGQLLYRYARQMLRLRDEALQAMDQFRGELAGDLPLGASTIPGAFILPPLIESFQEAHRSVQSVLKIAGSGRILEEVLDGGLELGIVGARPKDQRLEAQEIFADELVLVAWPGHRWCGRDAVAPGELPGERFILREAGSGTREVMAQALKGAGLDPAALTAVAEMGSSEAVRQGVKARLGISILSSLAVAEDLSLGTLVKIPLQGLRIERPFYLVRRKGRQLSPLSLAFHEHLHAHRPR